MLSASTASSAALSMAAKFLDKQQGFVLTWKSKEMSGDKEKLVQKWSIIKQQLIALCALTKLPKGNDELKKLLSEDIELKNLNAQNLHSFCYHILGILNCEERDKLIQWPLINIKTNTNFRKGVSAMVKNFQDKYPWAHIKKLPESYLMNPHGNHSRIIDFISRLTNLAIHIALDDSELLVMHSGEGLNSREIAIMTEIISNAKEEEEELIRCNVLPLKDIEDAIDAVYDKCIALRQENDELQQQLNTLKKHAVSEQFVPSGKNIDIHELKKINDESLLELNAINEELSKYYNLSKELLCKVKAFKNPLSLSSKDFGCGNTPPDLPSATSRVCGELCQFFQYLTMKNSTKEQEDDFYEKLKAIKKKMGEHNEALCSFLCSVSSKQKA